jgi:hypothetical protein
LKWTWSYTAENKRDLRFDLLRGFALLLMFINHVPVTQSWWYAFSGRGIFYISAAEGFYFISGVVLGLVSVRQDLSTSVRRVLRRAGQLYLAAVGMALFFSLLALTSHINLWQAEQELLPRGKALLPYLANYFILRTSFHGSSILVLYVIFMLFAPLAIWALKNNKAWLVLVVSGAVYLFSQLYPNGLIRFLGVYSHPDAWQILFFSGLVLGYHWSSVEKFVNKLPGKTIWTSLIFLVALGFGWIFATNYALLPNLPKILESRELLSWERLAFVYLYLATFIIMVTIFWKPLHKATGWLLLPLGQNSLWTFLAHWVVIVLVTNLPAFDPVTTPFVGALWQTLVVVIILGLLWLRPYFTRRIPNWAYSAVLLVLAFVGFVILEQVQTGYRVDDRSTVWQYDGLLPEASLQAGHGTLHVGEGNNLSAYLSFDGTGIELYTWKGTTGNVISVTIDGQTYPNVSLVNPAGGLHQQKAFSIQGLDRGEHELIIRSLAEGWMKIDYALVTR